MRKRKRDANEDKRGRAVANAKGCTELDMYVSNLRRWLTPSDRAGGMFGCAAPVPTIGAVDNGYATLRDARAAVAGAIESGAVTYDKSLNGWWRWYSEAATTRAEIGSTTLPELRERVFSWLKAGHGLPDGALQLARLPPLYHDLICDGGGSGMLSLLSDLRPHAAADLASARRAAAALATAVEHDEGPAAQYDFRWVDAQTGELNIESTGRGKKGFIRLVVRLIECAMLGTRAVSLSTRVLPNTKLHRVCAAISAAHGFSVNGSAESVCPAPRWTFGPPQQAAVVASEADADTRAARLPSGAHPRFYLILGSPGGVTPSHWDRGVQTVMYHTVAGTNHALAVPRNVALMLQAVLDGVGRAATAWGYALETEVLRACSVNPGEVRGGSFKARETMLILSGGGHAVLTGDEGKVVLAGEWHMQPAG